MSSTCRLLWLPLALLAACSSNGNNTDKGPSSDGPVLNPDVKPWEAAPPPPDGPRPAALNSSAPPGVVKLVFIHHSVGENWLRPDEGDLMGELNTNHYYVNDTNYEWGPDKIGDRTDIGQWHEWFLGPKRDTYMSAVYKNTSLTDSAGTNALSDPGGEATVIMFKSCFTQGGAMSGSPDDPPLPEGTSNPIYDQDVGNDSVYTVTNIKGLYRDLLKYFATRQDKLFVLIVPPPSDKDTVSAENMAALRSVATWLSTQLLASYAYYNVGVFDFSTVLTSNGGSTTQNDLGSSSGSHHRLKGSAVERLVGASPYLAYTGSGQDNHPTAAGSQKATAEFVPLLNVLYHCWRKTGACPSLMGRP
jgi:hypothetical protein